LKITINWQGNCAAYGTVAISVSARVKAAKVVMKAPYSANLASAVNPIQFNRDTNLGHSETELESSLTLKLCNERGLTRSFKHIALASVLLLAKPMLIK
jgi:hypothetical protein